MVIVVWLRRWFAALYAAAFMSVLAYASVAAASINEEMWGAFIRPDSWRWHSSFPSLLSQSVGIAALMGVLAHLIGRVDRKFDARRMVRANVNFRPLYHRFWRWPFMALTIWNLPVLAMLEEFIFRHGGLLWNGPIADDTDVLIRAVAFGAFHGVMTLNWRGGIMQATLGFWFSYQYLGAAADPLAAASMAHFLVDLCIVTPVFLAVALNGKRVLAPTLPACS